MPLGFLCNLAFTHTHTHTQISVQCSTSNCANARKLRTTCVDVYYNPGGASSSKTQVKGKNEVTEVISERVIVSSTGLTFGALLAPAG